MVKMAQPIGRAQGLVGPKGHWSGPTGRAQWGRPMGLPGVHASLAEAQFAHESTNLSPWAQPDVLTPKLGPLGSG